MAMKDSTKAVLNYLKEMDGKNVTLADIADAVGSTTRSVNGSVLALQRKEYVDRIPAEIEMEDGSTKATKFIVLTPAGKEFDPDAPTEE